MTRLTVGDYVRVTRAPGPWESSGESEEDLAAYVGHVGLVVECRTGGDDPVCLVRFPNHKIEGSGQRNIEGGALDFVSRPLSPICNTCLES